MPQDFSQMTDEQLEAIVRGEAPQPPAKGAPVDYSKLSDAQLQAIVEGKPLPEGATDVSGLEAFGRGAAQAFGLGYSPQLIAAAKTAMQPGSMAEEYEPELKRQKAATEAAWEQHPWLYGTGMVAAAVPAALNAVFAGPEELAAAGGLGGFWAGLSSIGGATGLGLRTAAAGSKGVLPALARVGAGVAESPIAQGAVYGTSEGENLHDKFVGALEGAAGAKIFPALLNTTGSAVSGAAKYIGNKFFNALGGTPSSAQIAADAAHSLGATLPLGAVTTNPTRLAAAKADPFGATAAAAKTVQSHMKNVLDSAAGEFSMPNAGAEKAGDSIKNGYMSWLQDRGPNGFAGRMNEIYAPIQKWSASPQRFDASTLKQTLNDIAASPKAEVSDISPTTNIIRKALESNDQYGGLTFQGLRDLRGVISDAIDHSHLPGAQPLDNSILNQMRAAVTGDMKKAAFSIGRYDAANALLDADKKAAALYADRDFLSKKLLGNFKADSPNARSGAAVYQNLANMAASKGRGGDLKTLGLLKSVLPADSWNDFQKAYVGNHLSDPSGFAFENFGQKYNSMTDGAKDFIFGHSGAGGIRDHLENIATLGRNAGDRLDAFAVHNKTPDPLVVGGAMAAAAEMAAQGIPLRTVPLAAAAAAYGRGAARNVATPLPPSAMQEMWNALGTTPGQREQWGAQIGQGMAPFTRGAQTLSSTAAPVVGAATLASPGGQKYLVEPAENLAGALAGRTVGNIFGRNESTGGRITRATGGRAGFDPEARAEDLMRAVETAKKQENAKTKPLLNVPDEAIVRALAVAKEAI